MVYYRHITAGAFLTRALDRHTLNKEPRLGYSLLQLLWKYPDQLNPDSPITKQGTLVMSAKLFVGNLASSTTSDEIRRLFAAIGAVQSCNLITDRATGQSKGFGFVEMDSVESAETAKEELNGRCTRPNTDSEGCQASD